MKDEDFHLVWTVLREQLDENQAKADQLNKEKEELESQPDSDEKLKKFDALFRRMLRVGEEAKKICAAAEALRAQITLGVFSGKKND